MPGCAAEAASPSGPGGHRRRPGTTAGTAVSGPGREPERDGFGVQQAAHPMQKDIGQRPVIRTLRHRLGQLVDFGEAAVLALELGIAAVDHGDRGGQAGDEDNRPPTGLDNKQNRQADDGVDSTDDDTGDPGVEQLRRRHRPLNQRDHADHRRHADQGGHEGGTHQDQPGPRTDVGVRLVVGGRAGRGHDQAGGRGGGRVHGDVEDDLHGATRRIAITMTQARERTMTVVTGRM